MNTEEKLLEALRNIRKHIERISPTSFGLAAVWYMANAAIKEYEDNDK